MSDWDDSDTYSDYDTDEPQNTDEELEVIFDNIEPMIDYVAKRYIDRGMYSYNDTYTRIFINDYYKRSFKIVVSMNTIYDILQQYESVIQERVNLKPDEKRQQKYNRYIAYVRSIILPKAKTKTKITFNNLFKRSYVHDDETIT